MSTDVATSEEQRAKMIAGLRRLLDEWVDIGVHPVAACAHLNGCGFALASLVGVPLEAVSIQMHQIYQNGVSDHALETVAPYLSLICPKGEGN